MVRKLGKHRAASLAVLGHQIKRETIMEHQHLKTSAMFTILQVNLMLIPCRHKLVQTQLSPSFFADVYLEILGHLSPNRGKFGSTKLLPFHLFF